MYKTALKKGSLFWITVFSILCITIFSMRFFVLPELFSYLFISIFIVILDNARQSQKTNTLWLLPILELLWVNMHIYFIMGIVLYGFFYLETLILQKKMNPRLTLIGIIILCTTLLNPSSIKGALLPFTFQTNYGFIVEENESPLTILSPNSVSGTVAYTAVLQIFVFETLLVLFGLSYFLKEQLNRFFYLANGSVSAVLAVKFTRCIALFSILGLIPLVETFTLFEEKIKKSKNSQMSILLKSVVTLFVAIVVWIHVTGLINYNILGFEFMPSAENAVAFMQNAHVKGRIFNNYIIGNYLIYKLYPKDQVYVDARPEAYPPNFFTNYDRMLSDPSYFNTQVKKYDINAVVFNVALDNPAQIQPFLLTLIQSPNWIPVYADGTVTIFVRNNNVNKQVIEKYKIRDTGDQ